MSNHHGVSPVARRSLKNIKYITISDNVPDHWDSILAIAKSSYSWFAWIKHQPDHESSVEHIHVLCYDKGGTTLDSHARRFESVIPKNMIQIVISPRAMARYLTHKDDPAKIQYDDSEVHTSSVDKYLNLVSDSEKSDSLSLWHDFQLVKRQKISVEDFIDKYRSEFYSMPFYQKISLYNKLYDYFGSSLLIDGSHDSSVPPANPLS